MKHTACIFCSASEQIAESYFSFTESLVKRLVEANFQILYGGDCKGLMKAVAKSTKDNGGRLIGVIPKFLHQKVTENVFCDELLLVNDLYERKVMLGKISNSFIVLPGGVGTFDELFSELSQKLLGVHGKKIVIVNYNGYYNHLLKQFETSVSQGFTNDKVFSLFKVAHSIDEVLVELLSGGVVL